jgi:tRNA U34 5-methylaminomethyl-2-thiouridine-forming methyltransferase MnmC
LEAYPLDWDIIEKLEYASLFPKKRFSTLLQKIHQCKWESEIPIIPEFILYKKQIRLEDYHTRGSSFDIIYYDAFGPNVQPELWTENIFNKLYQMMASGGVLVTYSAKGSVRRGLIKSGFTVDRLPGPPGKREMLRATKD